MSSTLPPTPSFDPNIPIVSSAGGSEAAYKDPNSPESIMKKTATLNAQAIVDSKYDVNVSAHKEGFCFQYCPSKWILFGFLLLLGLAISMTKIQKQAKIYLAALIIIIILLLLHQKNVTTC